MPEEAKAPAVDWVAKLAAEGWPVIRGGAPEEDETPPPAAGTPPAPSEAPINGEPLEASSESPDDTDWKQRYESMRPEFDRRQSILDDLEGRNGPERQAQVLEAFGIELDDGSSEEPEDDFDLDLLPDPNERVDALEQRLAEREQEEADRREERYIEDTISSLESEAGVKLTERQYRLVVNDALANRDPRNGRPNLEGAFSDFKAEMDNVLEGWGRTKDTHLPPDGTAGERKITPEQLRDKDKRQQLGAEIYEAAERAKSQ